MKLPWTILLAAALLTIHVILEVRDNGTPTAFHLLAALMERGSGRPLNADFPPVRPTVYAWFPGRFGSGKTDGRIYGTGDEQPCRALSCGLQ